MAFEIQKQVHPLPLNCTPNFPIVLVVHCCRTSHPKTEWLKTNTLLLTLAILWVDQAQRDCLALGSLIQLG